MEVIWIIAKILIYTVVLNVLFRQSFRLIFLFLQRPMAWMVVVPVLALANMLVAFGLSWDPRSVSLVVVLVFCLNISAPALGGASSDRSSELLDAMYNELGVTNGRLKYRIGHALFAGFSIVSYVLLFAESCSSGGTCTPLLRP